MVDLADQRKKIEGELNVAIQDVLESCQFIKGPQVSSFEASLASYHEIDHCIACANGTDALQIAMMALGLKPNDEVIVPAFTYVATAEVIALLGLKPVMVDVDADNFNIDIEQIKKAITNKTKAIVPVHLFGQTSDMSGIMKISKAYNLFVIEDNAQAIGADYIFPDGNKRKSGTIGHIGSTSFFPSKNLGCYGDGGALITNDENLAAKIRMVANHGQSEKYYHEVIGVNSRLDTLQAAILNVKLKYLDRFINERQKVAAYYDKHLAGIAQIKIPTRSESSTHVFHQYTLRIAGGKRDALKEHLSAFDIPSMVYYPVPLYKQKAFKSYWNGKDILPVTEELCGSVLSLPIHTEMDEEQMDYVVSYIQKFFS